MKRLAIFIGGLLVMPAFAEVAPVFYEDIEYTDVMYDENGEPILYEDYDDVDLATTVNENVTKSSVPASRNTTGTRTNTNRTTIGRTVPTTGTAGATGRASSANSSRAVAARTTSNTSPRSTSNARSVASRGTTTSRTTSTASTRTTSNVAATNAAATRATGGAGRATSSTRNVSTGAGTVARTATSTRAGTTSRVATTGARVNRAATSSKVAMVTDAISASPVRATSATSSTGLTSLTDSGKPLYNPNAAHVSVASGRSAARVPTIRVTSGGTSTDTVNVTAADLAEMDELAEMTDYCKAQYAACMDNYCNVLDDNQGRCSCSANIKNYAKAEAALKAATEELQDVAQKIQYIGLSAREVETLFTATEAELKMQTTTDTTQLKSSLDKVRDMIIEVQSGTASSTANSSALSFDLSGLLDFTIDSTGFDLSSFLGGFGTGTGDVSNQRGAELYKTATNRCKTNVLRACTANGVDASLITNAYDLEIDRECIAYERSLNDSNDQMVATVRNAKSVLQKARLLVEQSKNEYDMRGCINALDACMQDEYVCGSDYEKCLDPSGRYIVNGEIVIGSDPGRAVNGRGDSSVGVLDGDICSMNLYNVWNYGDSKPGQTNTSQSGCKNAWNSYSLDGSGNGDLADYINSTVVQSWPTNDTDNNTNPLGMAKYILKKIGWKGTGKDADKNYGMCMSVLNKCQDYTYTGTGTSRAYDPKNEVVKQYLNRMLIQIKAKQDQILAEHAESCISDVTTCLSQNNYPFDEENYSATSTAANIAINACRSAIVTCMSVNGYSVDNPTPSDLSSWICGITGQTNCTGSGGGENGYAVILRDNDTSVLGTLYYKNRTWYSNSSYTGSITKVPDNIWPTKSGYKIRGFSQQNVPVVLQSAGSLASQIVKQDKILLSNPDSNIYAAWAKDCTNPEHGTCNVSVSANGSVTYSVTCEDGYVPDAGSTATPNCVQSGNYKITYNCGVGGVGDPWNSQSYAAGMAVTLPYSYEVVPQHCTPPSGGTFLCWTKFNAADGACQEGNTVSIGNSDVSMYVRWDTTGGPKSWGGNEFGDGKTEP